MKFNWTITSSAKQLRDRDEVDSILIDEARTPLIISGASEESTIPTTSSIA